MIGCDPVKFSIVTPTLNAEAYFGDCLRSVRDQDYPRSQVEHIVLDGRSTDRTVEMAREAGAQIHVAQDGSLYEALNKGIALARGEWIVWLNADDTLKPDALGRVAEASERRPKAELVLGDHELLRDGRVEVIRSPQGALDRIRSGRRGRAWVIPLVAIYRSRTLRDLGAYTTRYRVVGDLDMWLRTAARSPALDVVQLDRVLGSFRSHSGSLSLGGKATESILRETIDLSARWAADDQVPAGVRRFARFLLRRNAYELRSREMQGRPAWRRKAETLLLWARWSRMGPGALGDFFTNFY